MARRYYLPKKPSECFDPLPFPSRNGRPERDNIRAMHAGRSELRPYTGSEGKNVGDALARTLGVRPACRFGLVRVSIHNRNSVRRAWR